MSENVADIAANAMVWLKLGWGSFFSIFAFRLSLYTIVYPSNVRRGGSLLSSVNMSLVGECAKGMLCQIKQSACGSGTCPCNFYIRQDSNSGSQAKNGLKCVQWCFLDQKVPSTFFLFLCLVLPLSSS